MLIRLFAQPAGDGGTSESYLVRKPVGPEQQVILAWIAAHFSSAWASEAGVALANRPVSLFIAIRGDPSELIGFCCYDATARGFVGPMGVTESSRNAGVGAALLRACLDDMRAVGYGYAVVGAVGAPGFFQRVAGATEIPDSSPGIYRGMLKASGGKEK
jgi:GNAT superfamily N-acetyltransferase